MPRAKIRSALALIAVAAVAGCASESRLSASVATDSSETIAIVASNAHAIGARSSIEGANAIVVVYQGSPRGFLTCTGSESMTGPSVLDARGRFVQDGDTVKIRTQYIATMGGAAGSEAIEFSDTTSATFSSGVTCQASGTFPGTLLAH
jgi:hypothetical protein